MFCKRSWTCSQPIRPQLRNLWQSMCHVMDPQRWPMKRQGRSQKQDCPKWYGPGHGPGLVGFVGPCGERFMAILSCQAMCDSVIFGQDFRDSGPAVFKQSKYPGQESKWFPCKSCFMLCSQSGRCHSYMVWCHTVAAYTDPHYQGLCVVVVAVCCNDSTSSYTDEPFAELALVDAAGCWHEAWIFEHFFADCWGASNSLLLFSHWQRCTVSKFHWNVLNCQGNRIINTYRLSAMFDFSYMIMYVHCM